jgi:hypothetical protein
VQSKVKNDIASLFYAGMSLLAQQVFVHSVHIVLYLLCLDMRADNLPNSALCPSAMMGMNTFVECCSQVKRLADV